MRKYTLLYMGMLLAALCSLASCSEESNSVEEFADWQHRNDVYFNNIYTQATQAIAAGSSEWKIIRNWSYAESLGTTPENNIVVRVLRQGTGSGSPLYNDSVWVHYSGRLIPSVSYPSGYVFSKSYYGTFDEATATPASMYVSNNIDGMITALQHMRIGDRWEVYIPYKLGYKAVENPNQSRLPAYCTLIFDLTLTKYAHP